MPTVEEADTARTPLGAALKTGVDTISYDQSIIFTKFVKKIMPLDGYVFWVRGDLVTPPAPATREIMGSLHYATERRQDEAETYSVNRVVFTSEEPVDFLNDIGPTTLYIATFNGLQFAFGAKKNLYAQAALWHYYGDAVYADMQSQLITTSGQLNALGLVVSNSLPVWLGFNDFNPNWPFYPGPDVFTPPPLYPSFLTTPNLVPPFGSVHIGENDTSSLVSSPGFSTTQSQYQLTADKVRITLWGANNATAQLFLAMVLQFSEDTGLIGLRNAPAIRDAKREQRELVAIAQKKIIEFEVSYIQNQIEAYARQLIVTAVPTYFPQAA